MVGRDFRQGGLKNTKEQEGQRSQFEILCLLRWSMKLDKTSDVGKFPTSDV